MTLHGRHNSRKMIEWIQLSREEKESRTGE